jgi:hypothetical protein
MATKRGLTVGDFYVTSSFRESGRRARKIPLGSSAVEHVLDFDNGSTLPYDVQATTILPDAPPHDAYGTAHIDFSYGKGARQTSWSASISAVGAGDSEKDAATIHCVTTTSQVDIRVHTTLVQYRLDPTAVWEDDPNCTFPLEVKINVT